MIDPALLAIIIGRHTISILKLLKRIFENLRLPA
jgi:hypothetical protein